MTAADNAVNVAEIAEFLRISKESAYRKAKSGEIPGFKVGRSWRFFPEAVKAKLSTPVDPWAYSPQSRAKKRRAA